MKYCCLILGLFLVVSCNKKEKTSEKQFSSALKTKWLDPIAVDSFAAPFGFKSIEFFKLEFDLRVKAKGYKIYSNEGFGDDFVVRKKDTLGLQYTVTFTKDNLIQKIEHGKTINDYFYDKHNNLVLRRFLHKDENSVFDRFTYDDYGNLISFYRYYIESNGSYRFGHYKEYYYSKTKEGTTVLIKGIEGWSDYQPLKVIEKFDNANRIVSKSSINYSPLLTKEVNYIKEYKWVKTQNHYHVSEEKAYMSNKPQETVTKLYEYNDEGKTSVFKSLEVGPNYKLDFKIVKEYSNHNLKQSVSSANSDNEKVIEVYPAKKNGLQETYAYKYNLQNDIIKEEHTTHTGNKEDIKRTENNFEYDANGNWNYKKQAIRYPYVKYVDVGYAMGDDFSMYVRKIDYSKNFSMPAIPKTDPKAEQIRKEILERYPLQKE